MGTKKDSGFVSRVLFDCLFISLNWLRCFLIPDFFPYEPDVDVAEWWFFLDYCADVADSSRALAVHAVAGFGAWIGSVEAYVVFRGGDGFDTFVRFFQVGYDFIDSSEYDDFFWAKHHGGDSVASAIFIYQLAIFGEGSGAGDEYFAGEM